MRLKATYYVRLDETILDDPEVVRLLDEKGYETFGIYVALLTQFRRYSSENFAIPFNDLKYIAKKNLGVPLNKLAKTVEYLVEIGFFKTFENINGDCFFYSERLQKELMAWQELKQKQIESANATNEKKRNKNKDSE